MFSNYDVISYIPVVHYSIKLVLWHPLFNLKLYVWQKKIQIQNVLFINVSINVINLIERLLSVESDRFLALFWARVGMN